MSAEKAHENRLRRMAERQGLALRKNRRRDPRAIGYGTYMLIDPRRNAVLPGAEGLTFDQVEAHLTGEATS